MLATTRVLELLESRGEFAPADLEGALAALDALVTLTGTWPEAARPNLQPLVSRFERKDGMAGSGAADSAQAVSHATTSASSGSIASMRDLLDQARTMATWLRDQESGYLPSTSWFAH